MARNRISLEQLDSFEVDEHGQLFWNGKAVVLERRITLRGLELLLAACGAVGALAAGLHPFLQSFGWLR